jgi:hypothetical protein
MRADERSAIARLVTVAAVSLLLVMLATIAARAASTYAVNWWTTDAGGGLSSTGGGYTLGGVGGQPDVNTAPASSGAYTLRGGFLSGVDSGQASQPPDIFLPTVLTGPG